MKNIQDQEYYRTVGKMVYNDSVKKNVEIMFDSSECRKYLMKNAESADPFEMLIEAVKCISRLTGDVVFSKQFLEKIERRRNETTD